MEWIKKNPEKFSLLVLSVALLGAAAFLVFSELKFVAGFNPLKVHPAENGTLPPLDTKLITAAQASLNKPATWEYNHDNQGSLFVSLPYVVEEKEGAPLGMLTEPIGGTWYKPVPNDWILKYHLNLMDSNVVNEDPDNDGFSNKEEYLAGTDPTDKNSHPPYTTKLFLEKYIQVPFRLLFNGQPDETSFQIDTYDIHDASGAQHPTQILKMGDTIDGAPYKIVNFEKKTKTDENGIEKDVSELTVQNTVTGKKVVLVVGVLANDPDSYALFKYFWGGPSEIKVKLDATFSIKPETDVDYKVVDITQDQAKIEDLKTNKVIIIPLLKKDETFHAPDGKYYDMNTGKEL